MAAKDGKNNIYAWIVAVGRYAVAIAMFVLVVLVIVRAFAFVLRPDELQLSIGRGSVSVDTIRSMPPPNVTFRVTVRAYNPSARFAGIQCNGTVLLLNITSGYVVQIASINLNSLFVPQLTTRVARTVATVPTSQVPDHYLRQMYSGHIIDATLEVDAFLIAKKRELSGKHGRLVRYYCWPVAVGHYSPYSQDTSCTKTPAGYGQAPQQTPSGAGGSSPQDTPRPPTPPGMNT